MGYTNGMKGYTFQNIPDTNSQFIVPLCASSRVTHYVCSTSQNSKQSFKGILYPISLSKSYSNLSTPQYHYSLSLSSHAKPGTYAEACKFEC